MASNFWLCLRTFLSAHRLPLALWFGSQILLLVVFRSSTPFSGEKTDIFYVIALYAAYAASIYAFVAYLGVAFNTHRKQSWLRQLPFSPCTLLLVPVVIIAGASLWYVVSLIDMWRFAYRDVGAPVSNLLFVLPYLNFYVIRRSRSPFLGAFAAALISLAYVAIHLYALMEWNLNNYGFISELPYIALLAILGFVIEKECKVGTLVTAAIALAFSASFLIHPLVTKPHSLSQVVLDLKIMPTAWSIGNFKTYTTDAKYWKSEPGKEVVSRTSIRLRQELAGEFLNDEEITLYLRNILDHLENFAEEDDRAPAYEYRSFFPLSPDQIGASGRRFLIENWQDNAAYCYFLPKTYEPEYMRLLFQNKSCTDSLQPLFFNFPYPHLPASDLLNLDGFLKTPMAEMPKEIGDTIRQLIVNIPKYPNDIKPSVVETVFGVPVLGDKEISLSRKYFGYDKRLKSAEWLKLDRAEFASTVSKVTMTVGAYQDEANVFQTVRYLCMHVSRNCEGQISREKRGSISYIIERRLRMRGVKGGDNRAEALYQLGQEVLKPEYWDQLKQLQILE